MSTSIAQWTDTFSVSKAEYLIFPPKSASFLLFPIFHNRFLWFLPHHLETLKSSWTSLPPLAWQMISDKSYQRSICSLSSSQTLLSIPTLIDVIQVFIISSGPLKKYNKCSSLQLFHSPVSVSVGWRTTLIFYSSAAIIIHQMWSTIWYQHIFPKTISTTSHHILYLNFNLYNLPSSIFNL